MLGRPELGTYLAKVLGASFVTVSFARQFHCVDVRDKLPTSCVLNYCDYVLHP